MGQPDVNRVIASRVQELRRKRGWSAQRLATECAKYGPPLLSRDQIAKIENNIRRRISFEEVEALARALGVTVEQLSGEPTLTVLQLSDLRLGAGDDDAPMIDALFADLDLLRSSPDALQPDLVLLTGDLSRAGGRRDFEQVRAFLERLSGLVGFERIAVVPGDRDVSMASCRAYFAECEADETEPVVPYWPKWRFFESIFSLWPDQPADARMQAEEPWSLFTVPELRVVVAGINSTIDDSHLLTDRHGSVGTLQADWFAAKLRAYEDQGWLRIGLVHHRVAPARVSPADDLRDTALVEEGIGAHLNLLLHGHAAPADGHMTRLVSGLPVSAAGRLSDPPPGDGDGSLSYALVQVTTSGVRRAVRVLSPGPAGWSAGPATDALWTDDLAMTWEAAHAAFPVSAPQPLTVAAPEPAEGASWGSPGKPTPVDAGTHLFSSREILLGEIADVWRARDAQAQIQGFTDPTPYLRVTYREGDLIRQLRIGAEDGPFTQATIDAFVAQVQRAGTAEAEFVYRHFVPPKSLRDYAALRRVRLRGFVELQGVLDLDRYVADQTERLALNPNYAPDAYVSQRFTDLTHPTPVEDDDLLAHVIESLDSDEGSFILLLGDFGRGKTFALRELAQRIPRRLPGLIPIFIELRALDKAHTIEGLVAAHLANHGQDRIDLNAFRYMHRHGRIVLIFDGFDELVARATYDRAADHLKTLLGAAQQQAKVIVASRTQHFRTRDQVLTVMGEQLGSVSSQRRILALSDLSHEQIKQILLQRYDHDVARTTSRMELLDSIPSLARLAANPRMLSFIAGVDEEKLRAIVQSQGAMSAAWLYQEILTLWLRYEEDRTQNIPGVPTGLGLTDLWQAVTTLALRMWETGAELISLDQLGWWPRRPWTG